MTNSHATMHAAILILAAELASVKENDRSAILTTVLDELHGCSFKKPSQPKRRIAAPIKRLTEGFSVATANKVKNNLISKKKYLMEAGKRDCVDMLIEEALDAHDFRGLRGILHMLGYGIPENEMNELEIPPEWDSVLDEEDFELNIKDEDYEQPCEELEKGIFAELNHQKLSQDREGQHATVRTLQLEFALRKQATPLIRIILCAYGHNIPFKEDGPSGKEPINENSPELLL